MKSYILLSSLAVILAYARAAPPKFENNFENIVFVEGSKSWALCTAANDSPIKYQWYNQQFGDVVTPNVDTGVSTSDSSEGSRLIFEKVSKSQEGIYTCTAENQHGLVSKLYRITVNSEFAGNDTFAVEDVHVLNVTDSSIELLVRASKPIDKYSVKYYEKLDNLTVVTQDFSKDDQLVLSNLIPSGLYTVRVQVHSPDGTTSDWSNDLQVTLLPYSPEMILRSLTGNSLQIEWSQKLNDFSRETIDGYSISYGSLRREYYDTWKPIDCLITIKLPKKCSGSPYTIASLYKDSYYEIQLRAHTSAGYGKPTTTRVHVV